MAEAPIQESKQMALVQRDLNEEKIKSQNNTYRHKFTWSHIPIEESFKYLGVEIKLLSNNYK